MGPPSQIRTRKSDGRVPKPLGKRPIVVARAGRRQDEPILPASEQELVSRNRCPFLS